MPRSFLVKQHDKTIDEQRNRDVDEDSKAPEISQDPPVPSLPPPLLKVSPRTSSQSVWVAKDDRHIPKLFTRSPTEAFYQRNIKSEVDVELLQSSVKSRAPILERSLADAWMLTGIDSRASIENHHLDGLTRQHGYRGVGYGQKQYVDTGYYQRPAEQKFHLQQRMELEKKGILNPLYTGGSVYHDPFMCYPHSLYTNTGLYGAKENTMFNQVSLLPKYYMTMPGSSTAYKTSQRKEQGADVNPKKQVDCRTTTKPDSSTNETNAVQSSQEIEALDHEYPASKTTTTPSQGDESKVEQSIAAKKYRYTCDVCGKSFSRSNTLTTHKRIHTGAKPFICEQCGRAFRQPGNLTRHRLTHTAIKPYVCTQCNKAFNRASNLHTHMRTHTNYKPFVCDFCGKGFHQKIDMKIHRYTHTGEKPHKCNKCGRGFKQLTHLTYHMRTHSDERLYKCEYCGKGFNQKGNLQAHIYGHTGERPFKCDICGKGFTLASTLNTHKRTHATKKPFECQFCGKAFYQKNALKTHYIASHPFANGMSLL